MSNAWVIAVLISVLLASSPMLLASGDRSRERALDRYARQAHLAVTDDVRGPVVRRIVTMERAALVGGLAGAAVGLALSLALQPIPIGGAAGSNVVPLAILLCAALGVTIGQALAAAIATVRVRPGRRIARSTAPAFSDYVPRLERVLCVLSLAGAVVTLFGGWLALKLGVLHSDRLDGGGVFVTLGAVFAGTALVLAAIGAILSRSILRAPQPAGSEQELAWDDALRANSLRALTTGPAITGVLSILTTILEVGCRTLPQPAALGTIGVVALFGITAAAIVLALVDHSSRPSQHYWRQLWQTAPESVAR